MRAAGQLRLFQLVEAEGARDGRTLDPDDVARLDLLLDGLGEEEVGLAVREPVGLVELDLARVVCDGAYIS